jgi:hypothetical protein
MKKHVGRPKLGTEHAKGVLMAIRFTPSEARQIESAAKRLGLTKSQFARKHLLSAVNVVDV